MLRRRPMSRTVSTRSSRTDAPILADRSRNRYEPGKGVLEVSSIFDWYKRTSRAATRA